MEFAYIITLAAFLVCFLAALVGLRLAASELSSPVPGSSWRCDAFLPVLLVSFAAFVLLFAFANRTYDQIFPLTWVDLLLAFVSAAAVYAVSLFKKPAILHCRHWQAPYCSALRFCRPISCCFRIICLSGEIGSASSCSGRCLPGVFVI